MKNRFGGVKTSFDLNLKRYRGKVPKPPGLPKAACINELETGFVFCCMVRVYFIDSRVSVVYVDILRLLNKPGVMVPILLTTTMGHFLESH